MRELSEIGRVMRLRFNTEGYRGRLPDEMRLLEIAEAQFLQIEPLKEERKALREENQRLSQRVEELAAALGDVCEKLRILNKTFGELLSLTHILDEQWRYEQILKGDKP